MHFPEFLLRQAGGLFMLVQGGPELPLYTVLLPPLRQGVGSLLCYLGKGWVSFVLKSCRCLSSKKPDAFPQRMLESRSA